MDQHIEAKRRTTFEQFIRTEYGALGGRCLDSIAHEKESYAFTIALGIFGGCRYYVVTELERAALLRQLMLDSMEYVDAADLRGCRLPSDTNAQDIEALAAIDWLRAVIDTESHFNATERKCARTCLARMIDLDKLVKVTLDNSQERRSWLASADGEEHVLDGFYIYRAKE
jgi:hypothetical protein